MVSFILMITYRVTKQIHAVGRENFKTNHGCILVVITFEIGMFHKRLCIKVEH